MNALVIYDSKFGNTRHIAEAIANALQDAYTVDLHAVTDPFEVPPALDLLVIGGPTHAHGVSQPMQLFLKSLPAGSIKDVATATFDTRFRKPRFIVGAASLGIAKRLRKHGARIVTEPESFFVESSEGPVEDGEIERAADWAREIATIAVPVG